MSCLLIALFCLFFPHIRSTVIVMDETLALTETLVKAIQEDKLRLAELLLEQGANPNLVLPSGICPFHLAIGTDTLNALAFVKLLLRYGGNPNVRSVDGMTPVHVAATWGRYQAMQLLLLNGGDPELCDEDGSNAVDMANENQSWDCMSLMTTYQTDEAVDRPELHNGYSSQTRTSWSLQEAQTHSECSWNNHSSSDLQHESGNVSLDSTGLSSYLQDASVSCSSLSACSLNNKSLSRSFFPDLQINCETGTQRSRDSHLCEYGSSIIRKLKTESGEYFSPLEKIRTGLEGKEQSQLSTRSTTLSGSKQALDRIEDDSETCCFGNSTSPAKDDFPSVKAQEKDDREQYKEECERTLTSKDLEEVLMNCSSTGLDLTSPDHPAVFTKVYSCHNGDTPPLDKTVVFMPLKRSLRQSAEIRIKDGCDRGTAEANQDLEVSSGRNESSEYLTCQSDDIVFPQDRQHFDKLKKRNSRRVTFCNDEKESDKNFICQSFGQTEARSTCSRHCSLIQGQDKNHGKMYSFESSKDNCGYSSIMTSDNSNFETSHEETFFSACSGPKREGPHNGSQQLTLGDNYVDIDKSKTRYSSSHPPSRSEEAHLPSCVAEYGEADYSSDHDSVEYLYHDQDTGAMLIERQCPSACGMASTHQDACVSSIDYSHISSTDETMLYDWRDYQTDDDHETTQPVIQPLSQELLQLTNKGIRELMQKYGEEAGPITATTRMVYLHHLAKLQNDPNFAARAASRQQNSQGFRWELAEYLNSGELAESELKMAADEQLMVAPFQTPDPMRRWREGTLKSSFNYLLLDPRVTKDLPGRCTQLTQLETFRIFVAAIFYIGKGKRGRPYAHFYEALSSAKSVKGDDDSHQTPRKAGKCKKQVGAKVRHILDIWAAGLGVVSLHCFQSVIPVEAYTREACMVDALGLTRLTNVKKGDFYGPSATFPARKRRQMGVFLLKKACQIFLVEGERQIRPADIALGQ